jgi:hypothetical protein
LNGLNGRRVVMDGAAWVDSSGVRRLLWAGRLGSAGALLLVCALASVALFGASRAAAAALAPLSLFPGSDALERPQAVAVDQATGDVYVLDLGGRGIDRFDSAGRPAAFSASQSYITANQLRGTPSEGFAFDYNSAAEVAVDNSGGPFNGDLYVTDSLHRAIDVFASSGAYLGQMTGSGTPQSSFAEPCGVAVDRSGRVYVGDFGGFVERYTPSASTLPIADGDYAVSEISGVSEPCAIAVDAGGDVFASRYEAGPLNEFEGSQFPPGGAALGVAKEVGATSRAVAVDQSTGRVYVDEGTQIAAYEISAGAPTLIEAFGSLSGASYGVAVYDPVGAGGTVYASDQGAGPVPTVEVFGAAKPAVAAIVDESVANVTADSADLQAQVNPDFADSTCHFEYGATTSYGGEAPVPGVDAGSAGGLAGPRSVSVHIRGLQPNTTYHYRVLAKNSLGTTEGSDATFTTQPAGGAPALPDGRAWEMVSPPEKNNSLITGIDGAPGPTGGGLPQAAAEGESVVYASNGAFAEPVGAPLAAQYLAKRSASGWSTVNITPPIISESYGVNGAGGPYKAFSANLSSGLLLNGTLKPIENPPLAMDAPEGYQNLYLQGLGTGNFQAVLTSTPSESPSVFGLELQSVTPDLNHIVFSTEAALTSNAVDNGDHNLYEWSDGRLQLVNILPGAVRGTPGAILGENRNGNPGGLRPLSDDGSVVFFTDENSLYARVNGTGTVQVDASREGLESGEGLFQTASSNGSRVFFTDHNRLTNDSTAAPEGLRDLYEYDLASGQLRDLTIKDQRGADVQRVLGASEDGSYVYFAANGVLAPGASRGHCALSIRGGGPQTCNLYVWHRGAQANTTTFIATLSEDDNRGNPEDWSATIADRTSRVTPDGLNLVFMSDEGLTGYDSRNAETGQREEEVYDYNAATGVLSCASCDPSGARPRGASSIPGGTGFERAHAIYRSRVLSDVNGRARVFFDSSDALVPQDTNGKQDVYEWEEDGRGGCLDAGGCVALISSGTSSSESAFVDASADGSDVFFLTYAELVPQDTDQLLDLYDAREGGGFPGPPTSPPACEGEACKQPLSPTPALGAPISAAYAGMGNPWPPRSKPAVKPRRRRSRPKRHGRKAQHKAKKAKRRGKNARHRARRARRSREGKR